MKHGKRLIALLLAATAALSSPASWAVGDSDGGPAVGQLNLHEPVTEIARQIFNLHTMMLVICLVIFIGVFGVMFYSIFKHRKSKGAKSATFHESLGVEIAWTIVPFLIVIGMALPATRTVVAMKDTSNSDVTIKITGMQWKWGYDYLNGPGRGISFLSNLATPRDQIENRAPKTDNYLLEVDNPMVVPVNRKIRIITTAADVIHSWGVPAFAVKQDAIPGFVRDTWFKAERIGTYRGQCVELCGKDHAFMPIVVKVVSDEDYAKWVEQKTGQMHAAQAVDPNRVMTLDELRTAGQKIYTANCVTCHQANGKGVPGAFPALDGSAVVIGPKDPVIDVVLHGRGKVMPAWSSMLSDADIASVVTFTRSAWSNKAADNGVQPADVRAARSAIKR